MQTIQLHIVNNIFYMVLFLNVYVQTTSARTQGINWVYTLLVSINRTLMQIQINDTKYEYTMMLNVYLKQEMHPFVLNLFFQ